MVLELFLRAEAYLEFGERKASSSTDFAIVLDGRAADDGSQFVNRARCNSCGFGLTSIATALFAAGLLRDLAVVFRT